MTRRELMGTVAASAAAVAAQSAPALPTVAFGKHKVTKLIIGSNPFYGYSHSVPMLDKFMVEWMTPERRAETLASAEQNGIGTVQFPWRDAAVDDWKRYRDRGGKMNVLLLSDGTMIEDWSLIAKAAKELQPIGIAHHGNRTDDRFAEGRMHVVRDFVKAVHDAGLPAGVSTHNPAVVRYIEDKGWDNDYYMTCLYRISRTVEDARKELGEAPVGEVFMEKDPERMTEMVRATKKQCFAFKLLAAGRNTRSPAAVQGAFRYALSRIKPGDAVIVGMCPKFRDEVKENADLVRGLLSRAS